MTLHNPPNGYPSRIVTETELTDEEMERRRQQERERIERALEDYPDECVVCGDELQNPHPDHPPVCGRACWHAWSE